MSKTLKSGKKNEKSKSRAVLYCFAVIKGLIVFTLGIAVLSLIILKNNPNSTVFYCFAYLIIALGSFTGGFGAHKKLRGRGFLNGLTASAVYMAVILIATVLIMKFNFSSNILIIVPICLISGFLGGTVSANT